MLQPVQIKDVSERYAGGISEFRDFFEKADCVLGTPDSLHAIASRLQWDRAFRRDLTSHLWVVVHLLNGSVTYADLLGMLAIAGAGPRLAELAHEEDAHALLRFVIEARRTLDEKEEPKSAPIVDAIAPSVEPILPDPILPDLAVTEPIVLEPILPEPVVPEPVPPEPTLFEPAIAEPVSEAPFTTPLFETPPVQPLPEVLPTPVQARVVSETVPPVPRQPSFVEFSPKEEEEAGGSRKRFLWIAAGLLAAAASGVAVHHYMGVGTADSQPTAAPFTATPVVSAPDTKPGDASIAPNPASEVASPPDASSSVANRNAVPAVSPTRSQDRSAHKPKPEPSTPLFAERAPRASTSAAVTSVAVPPLPPAPSHVAAPVVAHAAPAPVVSNPPAATPGSRLAVPAAATPADFSHTVAEHHEPRLIRRTPATQQDMAAVSKPTDIATSKVNASAAAEVIHGVVRADSVGVHSANVLYSPTPDYPAAAYTAHVQGEVKIETQVSREGNVVSVRVVSGPPLLREAALDAAQRWRYRPLKVGGQAIPMSALSVFEFQLP